MASSAVNAGNSGMAICSVSVGHAGVLSIEAVRKRRR